MKTNKSVIIIGAGLSGLTLAYLLSKHQVDVTILEASERIGGRIHTVNGRLGTPLELGATWFSDLHTNLVALLNELGIKKFPQHSDGISLFQTKSFEPAQQFYIPASDTPSYRITGGTQQLITALQKQLAMQAIKLNSEVTAITREQDVMAIFTANGIKYKCQTVVVCIPPQLAAHNISFSPGLPVHMESLMPTVQTWMAGAIKFVVEYENAFWRKNGYSGMLYSHAGIITEMYDHTNFEESRYGFTGFLSAGALSYPLETRKELVIEQLKALFSNQADIYSTYIDKVWTDRYILSGNQVVQRPHQNNGHLLLQNSYLENSLHFCGTETATAYAGYMEGAIIAAKSIMNKINPGSKLDNIVTSQTVKS